MKRFFIGSILLLFITIISLSIVLYRRVQDSKYINKEIKEKQKELDNLIKLKKDKIERYQKIKKWNEEITSYLE